MIVAIFIFVAVAVVAVFAVGQAHETNITATVRLKRKNVGHVNGIITTASSLLAAPSFFLLLVCFEPP